METLVFVEGEDPADVFVRYCELVAKANSARVPQERFYGVCDWYSHRGEPGVYREEFVLEMLRSMEELVPAPDRGTYVMDACWQAIRNGAGPETPLLACNAMGPLTIGVVDLQRIGDDTSPDHWEAQVANGAASATNRFAQHRRWWLNDADVVISLFIWLKCYPKPSYLQRRTATIPMAAKRKSAVAVT